jgi:hypothetical protein
VKSPAAGLQWAAPDSNGIAHAIAFSRRLPTVCGMKPWAPRFDWPVRKRCPACVRAVEVPVSS